MNNDKHAEERDMHKEKIPLTLLLKESQVYM